MLKKGSVDCMHQMLEKYNAGASKDVYNIVTGDKSWIYTNYVSLKQSGTPTISLEKFKKRTRKYESLFTMAMRVLTHRLK